MPDGWKQIVAECMTSCAYPTVLVYEVADQAAVSDPPFIFEAKQLKNWKREAELADENLFTEDNIRE